MMFIVSRGDNKITKKHNKLISQSWIGSWEKLRMEWSCAPSDVKKATPKYRKILNHKYSIVWIMWYFTKHSNNCWVCCIWDTAKGLCYTSMFYMRDKRGKYCKLLLLKGHHMSGPSNVSALIGWVEWNP